jgi:hypothetical protein
VRKKLRSWAAPNKRRPRVDLQQVRGLFRGILRILITDAFPCW